MGTARRWSARGLTLRFFVVILVVLCCGVANTAQAGLITGTVRDSSLSPIANVSVWVYDLDYNFSGIVWTNELGEYSVGLPTGTYKVNFVDFSNGFIDEWYADKASFDSADIVPVVAEEASIVVNAILSSGGTITGVLTDELSTPIATVSVYVYDLDYHYVDNVPTNESGEYSVVGLPTGSYKVRFDEYSHGFIDEWYADKASFESADTVSVVAGEAPIVVNGTLSTGGTITGTVTDALSTPIAGVDVNVYDLNYQWVGSATTDGSGVYTIGGLATGNCKLQFSGQGFVSEWYSDKASFSSADVVPVVAGGDPAVVNAALSQGGKITGTVTDALSTPIPNVYVGVYDLDYQWVSGTATDQSGAYTIGGLATGSYKLRFDGGDQGFVSEWYSDKASFSSADGVPVVADGPDSVANVTLSRGGTISGIITGDADTPLSYFSVSLSTRNYSYSDWVQTDQDGRYTFSGVPPGQYRLYFEGGNGYIGEYWNDKTWSTADLIAIVGEETVSADATLGRGGTISGLVTDSGSTPLADIEVSVCDLNWDYCGWGSTSQDGTYSVVGLPPGDYRVSFYDYNEAYMSEYWDNKWDWDQADVITVVPDGSYAANAVLGRGASISGNVAAFGGGAIANVDVSVLEVIGESTYWRGWATTDANGDYTVTKLPPGTYYVRFSLWGSSYLWEYYGDTQSMDTATSVTIIGEEENVGGINAELDRYPSISGIVTLGGAPQAGVLVDCNGWPSTVTAADGTYTLSRIYPGNWCKLRFTPQTDDYLGEWYDNQEDWAFATTFTLAKNEALSGVNADLTATGRIEGAVAAGDGGDLGGRVVVEIYAAPENPAAVVHADVSNSYTYRSPGLRPGVYRVKFRPESTAYGYEWFNDQSSMEFSNPVTVAGGVSTVVNAVLEGGGGIAGAVSAEPGGDLSEGVQIYAYDGFGEVAGRGHADPSSSYTYTIDGLRPGAYRVGFTPHVGSGYVGEFNADKLTLETANPVAVNQGVVTTVDATLGLGRSILGAVTAGDGGELGRVRVDIYGSDRTPVATVHAVDVSGSYEYRTPALTPGGYYVRFSSERKPYSSDEPFYASEFYQDQPSFAGATLVTVDAAMDASGVNAVLDAGGKIEGTVSADDAGDLGARVVVDIYTGAGDLVGTAHADASKGYTYRSTALVPGEYLVRFVPVSRYQPEYYPGAATIAGGTLVAVGTGVVTSGIDASLEPADANRAPVAANSQVEGTEDSAVLVTLAATDADNDDLSYVIVSYPQHGSLDGDPPNLTYTPAANYFGPDSFTFVANDTRAESNVAAISITVAAVEDAPILAPIGGKTVGEGGQLSISLSASDADGSALTYDAAGLPSGASFDAGGRIFAWTPGYDQAGVYEVTFRVGDGSGSDSEVVWITVVDVNRPPSIEPIVDQVAVEGDVVSFKVAASDPDSDGIGFAAFGLPEGAQFDSNSGSFVWTPGLDQAGDYLMTFRAIDTGTPPLWSDWTVAITVTAPAGPVFADDFTLGAAPADWRKVSGTWAASRGTYGTTSITKNNLSTIVPLDPLVLPLGAGVVQAKVKLTSTYGRSGPNGLILFGYQSPTQYRYVKITGTQLIIGQTGTFAGVAGGVKRKVLKSQALNRFALYTVKILPDGWVRIFKGTATKPALSYRFPNVVQGGAGLAATKAKTVFDNVTVWDDTGL